MCRSPFIAAVLATRCPELTIASAGIGALVGELPAVHVRQVLAACGVSADVLAPAQQISRRMVRDTRLIITATRHQRVAVVAMDRTAAARAFTLTELARVLFGAPAGLGVENTVRRAAMHAEEEIVDHDDDLADPHGLDQPAYEAMGVEVDRALAILVPAICTQAC